MIYHLGYVWRAVYRRQLLVSHGVHFPDQLLYGEDTTFMAEGVMYGERVMAIDDVLYNYCQEVVTSSSAQLAEMKGVRIYESIFRGGELIVALKDKADPISVPLANAIEKGLPWFVNRLLMRLVKTTAKECQEFYNSLIINVIFLADTDCGVRRIIAYMDKINRFVVEQPFLGKIVLSALHMLHSLCLSFRSIMWRNT